MSIIKIENQESLTDLTNLGDKVKASFNSEEDPVSARNFLIEISNNFPTVMKHNRSLSSDIFKNENLPNIKSEIEFDSFEIYKNVEFDNILGRTMSISNFPTFQKYFQKYAAFRTRGNVKSIHLKYKFIDQVDAENFDKKINTIPFPLERKRKIAKKRTFETSSYGSSPSPTMLDQKIPKTEPSIAPMSSNIIVTTLPANQLQTQHLVPTISQPIEHNFCENTQFNLLGNLCQANQQPLIQSKTHTQNPVNLDLTLISTLLNIIQNGQKLQA